MGNTEQFVFLFLFFILGGIGALLINFYGDLHCSVGATCLIIALFYGGRAFEYFNNRAKR